MFVQGRSVLKEIPQNPQQLNNQDKNIIIQAKPLHTNNEKFTKQQKQMIYCKQDSLKTQKKGLAQDKQIRKRGNSVHIDGTVLQNKENQKQDLQQQYMSSHKLNPTGKVQIINPNQQYCIKSQGQSLTNIKKFIDIREIEAYRSCVKGEIFLEMLEKQKLVLMSEEKLKKFQNEDFFGVRILLTNWLYQIYQFKELGIQFDTLILSIQLLDLYMLNCSEKMLFTDNLEIVAALCMHIALKFEQIECHLSMGYIAQCLKIKLQHQMLVECDILRTLDFQVNNIRASQFIGRLVEPLRLQEYIQKDAELFLIICMQNITYLKYEQSNLASLCVYSSLLYNKVDFDEKYIEKYFGCKLEKCREMFQYLDKQLQNVKKNIYGQQDVLREMCSGLMNFKIPTEK